MINVNCESLNGLFLLFLDLNFTANVAVSDVTVQFPFIVCSGVNCHTEHTRVLKKWHILNTGFAICSPVKY
jgi:hypothetical protein